MSRAAIAIVTMGLLVGFAGCDDDRKGMPMSEQPAPPRAPANTAATPAVTPQSPTPAAPQPQAVRDEDIPVEADFEEETERDITPANMEAELASIEKALAAEGAPTEGLNPSR